MAYFNTKFKIIYTEKHNRMIAELRNLKYTMNKISPDFEYLIDQMIVKVHEIAIPSLLIIKDCNAQ